MKKIRSHFRKVVVILCLCVFSLYYYINRIEDHYGVNVSTGYFVDTPGCRMPRFEVIDGTIAKFFDKPPEYSCSRALLRSSDTVPGQLYLNMDAQELLVHYNISDLTSVHCNYSEVKRRTDRANDFGPGVDFSLDKVIQLSPNAEFLCLWCYDSSGKCIYKDCHFFAVEKARIKPVSKRRTNRMSLNSSRELGQERISVMILGIDSLSHLNFLRQMSRSADYIRQHLSHVEMWGYNKVGDNTYPNVVPLLSGLDEQELGLACSSGSKPYDSCSFIWKRFQRLGYRTAFAEDVARLASFNFNRNGFNRQPTDYYMRPIMLEMERELAEYKKLNIYLCMGSRRTADVLLEYIRKLVPLMSRELFFSFFWSSALTHDYINYPALLDQALLTQLTQLQESGLLNRTVVMLLSDHGIRWGSFRRTYQGMMEERQPLVMVLYPPWMNYRYPEAIANLRLNARRLTTPFDVHATMLNLLNLGNLEAEQVQRRAAKLDEPDSTLPRGISLFLPVPAARTCEQAGIAAHWCTCHQRRELQTNDARVQRAARYLVRLINHRLKDSTQCRTLYLNSILQALIAAPHSKIVNDISTGYAVDITLRLQTEPGLGVFESTVRISGYKNVLTGTISRLNLYGSQSYCLNDTALKLFCYCH